MFAEAVVVAAPDQELPVLPAVLVRDEVAYQGPGERNLPRLESGDQRNLFRDLL